MSTFREQSTRVVQSLTFTKNFATVGTGKHVTTFKKDAVDGILHAYLAGVLIQNCTIFVIIFMKQKTILILEHKSFNRKNLQTFKLVADLLVIPQQNSLLN